MCTTFQQTMRVVLPEHQYDMLFRGVMQVPCGNAKKPRNPKAARLFELSRPDQAWPLLSCGFGPRPIWTCLPKISRM
jgi:hypothetical protein